MIRRIKHDIYPFIDPSHGLRNAAAGKDVLVTGGSQGIGKAIALHFAHAGASSVTISGRNMASLMSAAEEIRTAAPSCEVRHIPADVTVQESVYKLFEQMPGIPDILINNAGVASSQTPLADSSIDAWWSDFAVSVRGVYLCSREFLIRRMAQDSETPAVILNTSSSVSTTTNVGLSGYASAKTAVNRLTEFIQLEYSSQNVRCIAFHPGGILHTGMGQSAPPYFKPYLYDTVDLAAGTAVYLSTPRAGFLGGRFVFANYDMEALENLREEIIEKDLLKTKVDFGSALGSAVVPPTQIDADT